MKGVLAATLMVVMAGPASSQGPAPEVLTFVADLQGRHVAPAPVDTTAAARATAVLAGNRFTVHGSFTGLSSALRDIEKTPDDPGIHLHQGASGETSRYFHGLQVRLNADERSGIFFGTAVLSEEQRKALLTGGVYVDIHTVKNGPGEVRDQWRPLDAAAAARALAASEKSAPALIAAAQMTTGGSCH